MTKRPEDAGLFDQSDVLQHTESNNVSGSFNEEATFL